MASSTVGTLSSAGLGSGLDVTGLVSKLMDIESQPLKDIDTKEASFQAKISAFGTLKSGLSALETAANAINSSAKLMPLTASVGDSSILSANVGATAAAGSYNIEVQKLATSQKVLSGGYINTINPVGTFGKTITFNFGTYSANDTVFTPNASKPAKSITLDTTNNSLTGLRDAINKANMGVTAAIVNDGSGTPYHLVFTSNDTGAASAMKITVNDASLNALTYDPTGGTSNMTQTVAAQDAVIKVDTLTITKPTNSISDAIPGVTLNLTKQSAAGVTTRLTIAPNSSGMKAAVQAMVDAYNNMHTSLVNLTAYDATNSKAAVLTGDATARLIDSQLRGILNTPIVGAPANSATLADVGITFQRDGSLKLDSAKFDTAMADPTKDFSALFASKGSNKGYALQIGILAGQLASPVGLIGNHTKNLNSSIQSLENQRLSIKTRLVSVEANYRRQFTALDSLVSSMQQTSTFLTQQLAGLSKNNS